MAFRLNRRAQSGVLALLAICFKHMLIVSLCLLHVVVSLDDTAIYLGNRIVDAINCGGGAHTDVHGIRYRADPLEGKAGISSDYGRRYLISRVHPDDHPLYQTERYGTETFEYDLAVPDDGQYVLVIKFSEVYFEAQNQKVFGVTINNQHHVITDLDIFARVGKATALEQHVPFIIEKGSLRIYDVESKYTGKLHVQFVKGAFDNPKCNALYVIRGVIEDIPELPPMKTAEDDLDLLGKERLPDEPLDDDDEFGGDDAAKRRAKGSGPKAPDPYADQDHSQMFLPILVAFACFFPVLFCLCKL